MAWKCPFCNHYQVVTDINSSRGTNNLHVGQNKYKDICLRYSAIACLNEDCQEVYLTVSFNQLISNNGPYRPGPIIEKYTLRHEFTSRIFPDYIPVPLRQDYVEACRIKSLSPKASATLSRRCIQGIIRDFCGISKSTLNAEINGLRDAVTAGTAPQGVTIESVEAIDHVRKIGNIGAHMEKDINIIVDIDDGEAQLLIDLIEALFDEWYIEREKRALRFNKLKAVRDAKEQQQTALLSPPSSNSNT